MTMTIQYVDRNNFSPLPIPKCWKILNDMVVTSVEVDHYHADVFFEYKRHTYILQLVDGEQEDGNVDVCVSLGLTSCLRPPKELDQLLKIEVRWIHSDATLILYTEDGSVLRIRSSK